MRQLQISILLILTLIQNVNSQDKVIKGDTAFWYNRNQEQFTKLELIDFNKSQTDFAFRFWNHGQVVELIKDGNQINGQLINYIYHSNRKNSDTIINKTKLDPSMSLKAFDIIQRSGVLNLQSGNKIEGWSRGYDGNTYIIEHSDKNEYWFKNYWTPSVQDSIPEALIVNDLVNALSDTLQLSEKYSEFKEGLPHKGCYNSGKAPWYCYPNNAYRIGYLGSTKLTLGLHSSIYLTFIGKTNTDFGLSFEYKTDRKDNYTLGFNARKNKVFLKKLKNYDFFVYSYQKRKLDFIEANTVFYNHQITYGISFNSRFNFSAGIDYLSDIDKKVGLILGIFKYFNKPKISTTLTSTIFKTDIDYKIGVSKNIHLNNRFLDRGTSIGLYFENFKDYNDLNFKLIIWI